MIKRIVKMTFVPGSEAAFKKIYFESRHLIRQFEGCDHVELLQDLDKSNIFFTFSRWQSVAHLNNYRKSELFGQVWKKTKALFEEKASAWTLEEQEL